MIKSIRFSKNVVVYVITHAVYTATSQGIPAVFLIIFILIICISICIFVFLCRYRVRDEIF